MDDELRKAFEEFEGFDEIMSQLGEDHDPQTCPIISGSNAATETNCMICKLLFVHLDEELSQREAMTIARLTSIMGVISPGLLLTLLASGEDIVALTKLAYMLGKHYSAKLERED